MGLFLLTKEGARYCDWRIEAANCEEALFFYNCHLSALIFALISAVCVLYSAIFRWKVLKISVKSFTHGSNGALFWFFFECLLYFVYSMMVIAGADSLAIEVIWAILYPFTLIPAVFLLSTIIKGLPSSLMSGYLRSEKGCSERGKRLTMVILLPICLAINVALITPAAVFARGTDPAQFDIARSLFQAAMVILSFFIALLAVSLYTYNSFMNKVLTEGIKAGKEFQNPDIELFELTRAKLKQTERSVLFNAVTTILGYLLLAFYVDFFTNMPFSQAFAVIVVPFPPASICLLNVFNIVVDVKKALYQKKQSTRSVSSNGKKNDSSLVEEANKEDANKEDANQITKSDSQIKRGRSHDRSSLNEESRNSSVARGSSNQDEHGIEVVELTDIREV